MTFSNDFCDIERIWVLHNCAYATSNVWLIKKFCYILCMWQFILRYVTTITWWECVEKHYMSHNEKKQQFWQSVTSSELVLPLRWMKRQYKICFQERPDNNTVPIILEKMQFRTNYPRMVASFASHIWHMCQNLLLSYRIPLSVSQKKVKRSTEV